MIRIRHEEPGDHDRVFAINAAAFGQPDEAELVNRLRAEASPQLSLVAEAEGEVVGHIFFSPVSIEGSRGPLAAGLAPVAVEPAWQRQGIGSALIREGLERCRGCGWQAVFVVGDPAYYRRFGFEGAAARGLWYDEAVGSAFQCLELSPGALEGCRGRVHFHEVFASL